MKITHTSCWLLLAASVSAQQVILQTVPTLPSVVSATAGMSTDTQSSNVSPALFFAGAASGAASAGAQQIYSDLSSAIGAQLRVEHYYGVVAPPPQTASASCTTDLRLDLFATAPTLAFVDLEIDFQGSVGAPQPAITLDVLDDGAAEYQSGQPLPFPIGVLIDTTTTPIRLSVHSQMVDTGEASLVVKVLIRPGHPTSIVQQAIACDDTGNKLFVWPMFDGGLVFSRPQLTGAGPDVLVFGLGMQPLFLPAIVTLPCLLLPSPDILVLMPASQQFVQPLPATLRPITFWVQGVELSPYGLLTSDSYRVDAL